MRLLGRLRSGRGEPELYAALTHATRYCGLLEASAAAHEQARRRDPEISTSVNHTYFQLGDLVRAQQEMGRGTIYLDAAILFEQGRIEEASRLLRDRERENLLPTTRSTLSSLRLLIEGRHREAVDATVEAFAQCRDPEGAWHLARQLAYLGAAERAIAAMQDVLQRGYTVYRCLMRRDTWLDSVKSHPTYPRLLTLAQGDYRAAYAAFIDANGEKLLGVSVASPGP